MTFFKDVGVSMCIFFPRTVQYEFQCRLVVTATHRNVLQNECKLCKAIIRNHKIL